MSQTTLSMSEEYIECREQTREVEINIYQVAAATQIPHRQAGTATYPNGTPSTRPAQGLQYGVTRCSENTIAGLHSRQMHLNRYNPYRPRLLLRWRMLLLTVTWFLHILQLQPSS